MFADVEASGFEFDAGVMPHLPAVDPLLLFLDG